MFPESMIFIDNEVKDQRTSCSSLKGTPPVSANCRLLGPGRARSSTILGVALQGRQRCSPMMRSETASRNIPTGRHPAALRQGRVHLAAATSSARCSSRKSCQQHHECGRPLPVRLPDFFSSPRPGGLMGPAPSRCRPASAAFRRARQMACARMGSPFHRRSLHRIADAGLFRTGAIRDCSSGWPGHCDKHRRRRFHLRLTGAAAPALCLTTSGCSACGSVSATRQRNQRPDRCCPRAVSRP